MNSATHMLCTFPVPRGLSGDDCGDEAGRDRSVAVTGERRAPKQMSVSEWK